MGTLWRTCVKVCEAIELLFGVVSGVSRGMNILDGSSSGKGMGGFGGFLP